MAHLAVAHHSSWDPHCQPGGIQCGVLPASLSLCQGVHHWSLSVLNGVACSNNNTAGCLPLQLAPVSQPALLQGLREGVESLTFRLFRYTPAVYDDQTHVLLHSCRSHCWSPGLRETSGGQGSKVQVSSLRMRNNFADHGLLATVMRSGVRISSSWDVSGDVSGVFHVASR